MMKSLIAVAFAAALSSVLPLQAARAQDNAPILIASTLPLSGNVASFGEMARWGAELAVAQANAAGGIRGRKVQFDVQDNRCNPAEAVKVTTQMLSNPAYVALFDGLCSSVVLSVMPVVERERIPLVVATASATSISDKSGVGGNPWTFKFNPSDATLAVAMVDWLKKQGLADKIAFLGEDTDFGRSGAGGFETALKTSGGKLAASDFYQQGTADFSAVLTKLRSLQPSVLALYALAGDQRNIVSQFMTSGLKMPLTGRLITDVIPAEIIKSGVIDGSTSVQPYSFEIDTPENKAFVAAFKAAHGREPNAIAYSAYDAMRTLLDAIARAPSVDRTAIRDALKATRMQSLIGGEIVFDENNLAHNYAVILQIKDGKVSIVGLSKT
ncbi:ABC transporter substrate-binding protein [Hyphomicrobiales bacterium]|nr:ABC transporter substrate-binding protein [Hyphomicrobiales bacterium]CAH1693633.1 ABC transporter substrate-binding protein [Hyphomicrobiales bacterium]